MCVVSMVMDHYRDNMPYWPKPPVINPTGTFSIIIPDPAMELWKASIEARLAEMEKLILAAKEYDKKNNEPDCEMDEKRVALKKLADELGIEIKFL